MKKIIIIFLFIFVLTGMKSAFAATKVQPMVSGGFNFSAILKGDGTVWTCGGNEVGNLGNGKYDLISKPSQVLGLSDVVAIDCADAYTLALKSDGTVWGWGFNEYDGLGTGKPETCYFASPIHGISDVKAIAAGNHMSIFVKKDGTLWYVCEQNGRPSAMKTFKSMKDIVAVSSAHMSAIALTKNGEVWTWEWESVDNYGYKVSTPIKQKLKNIKAVEAGEFHYMALEKSGDLWIWGMNNSGEIGDGTHNWCYHPKKVTGLKHVKMISAGGYYSLAELEDGTFYAWGNNDTGQFGNHSTKSTTKPVKVKGFKNVVSMDGGMYHTLAINQRGEVIAAGNNYDGVLGVNDKKAHTTPVVIMDLNKKTSATNNDILTNGDLSDWGAVAPIAEGTAPTNTKLVGIKALYVKFSNDGSLRLAASITGNIPAYVNFNLDVNDDKKADYKVCFANDKYATVNIYKINGKSLKKVRDDGYGVYGKVIETSVYLDEIGRPDKVSVTATYGTDKKKYGVNTEITKWAIASGSKIAVEDRSIKMGVITLDGKLNDWDNINKTVIQDPQGDSDCKADITTIYTAMDDQYLYVAAYVTGKPSVNTKLDYDGDGLQEYGANASSTSGEVYYFQFLSDKDANDIGKSENIAYNGKVLEFAIPLEAIGNPKSCSIHIWTENGDNNGSDEVEGYHEIVKINAI